MLQCDVSCLFQTRAGTREQVRHIAVDVPMACDDVGVFVHEGKLLLLPKSRGNSSHVCVLYPETGRYQLYTLDNLSKVSVAPLCLWSERERDRRVY